MNEIRKSSLKQELIKFLSENNLTISDAKDLFDNVTFYLEKEMPITNGISLGDGQVLINAIQKYVDTH